MLFISSKDRHVLNIAITTFAVTSLPLVSICIPTYNAEDFIAEAIASALAQTYRPIEIILSDDNSSDRTVEIVGELVEAITKLEDAGVAVKLLTHDRYGLGQNWNYCIDRASGKYIKFLFQDDLLKPDCVAKLVDLAEQDEAIGLVFSRRGVVLADDTQFDPLYVDITSKWTDLKSVQLGRSLLADPNLLLPPLNKIGEPSNVLIRKQVFEQVGRFDPNLVQVIDLDMWLRIMSAYKVGFVDELLAEFRVHAKQQSHHNVRSGAAWIDDWLLYFKMLSDRAYEFLSPEAKQQVTAFCSERIGKTYHDLDDLRSQVVETCDQLEKNQAQMLEIHADLQRSQQQYWQLSEQYNLQKAHLEQAQSTITAMESSKFWQMRNAWLRLKQRLGLSTEE